MKTLLVLSLAFVAVCLAKPLSAYAKPPTRASPIQERVGQELDKGQAQEPLPQEKENVLVPNQEALKPAIEVQQKEEGQSQEKVQEPLDVIKPGQAQEKVQEPLDVIKPGQGQDQLKPDLSGGQAREGIQEKLEPGQSQEPAIGGEEVLQKPGGGQALDVIKPVIGGGGQEADKPIIGQDVEVSKPVIGGGQEVQKVLDLPGPGQAKEILKPSGQATEKLIPNPGQEKEGEVDVKPNIQIPEAKKHVCNCPTFPRLPRPSLPKFPRFRIFPSRRGGQAVEKPQVPLHPRQRYLPPQDVEQPAVKG